MQTFAPTDADAYKALARCWAATVNIVTVRRRPECITAEKPELEGFTATAFMMVSISPPLIRVSVSNETSALPMMQDAASFEVNLLAGDQQKLANLFASSSPERKSVWNEIPWTPDADGVPLITGAQGAFSARPQQVIPAGDHTLVLGAVTAIHTLDGRDTLAYLNRHYCKVTPVE